MSKILTECPECGAIFGIEEIDLQKCHSCGYKENPVLNDSLPTQHSKRESLKQLSIRLKKENK